MEQVIKPSLKQDFLRHFDFLDFSFDQEFFKNQREEARELIQHLDFPTSKMEYWKYTRLNKVLKGNYSFKEIESSNYNLEGLSENRLVFINGYFSEILSNVNLEEGVYFAPLSQAKEENKDLQNSFGKLYKRDEIFAVMNQAYHQDGAVLMVQKGKDVEKELLILNIIDGENIISQPRNLIHVSENAQAKVILKTIGYNTSVSFTNMLTEVFVDKAANLEIAKIQEESPLAYQIATELVKQKGNSFFKINTFTFNGALVRNNLNIDLLGQHTESWLSGLYLLKDKQHVDNHTYVFHREPNCESNELYKGILDDQSTGVFNGKVFVHRDAQKTNAYQSNSNMLMTDNATINSKPELEIYADDVKCSHGSTTGQLDEEALFYLRSRGIGYKTAMATLLKAFSADVIDQIGIESVQLEVEEYINKSFKGV